MPAEPPKLPPIVKGARDEFSGARDILRAMGLKPAHDHFLAAGRPPAALNCDTELPGISAGFELRQGRAMELAPLLEARPRPRRRRRLRCWTATARVRLSRSSPRPFRCGRRISGTVPAVIRRAKDEAAAAAAAAGNAAKSTGEGAHRRRTPLRGGRSGSGTKRRRGRRRRRSGDGTRPSRRCRRSPAATRVSRADDATYYVTLLESLSRDETHWSHSALPRDVYGASSFAPANAAARRRTRSRSRVPRREAPPFAARAPSRRWETVLLWNEPRRVR